MKKINSLLLTCFSMAMFTACSTNNLQADNTEQATDQAKQEIIDSTGYRCEKVMKTGSNIPTKRCTTAVQREAERTAARENIENKNHKRSIGM
jgi:ribosomal protein S10